MSVIAVVGAAGMLGRELAVHLQADNRYSVVPLTRKEVDIASRVDVLKVLQEVRPQYVLHAAAYTQVDQAESDVAQCRRINVDGTRHLAEAAAAVGAVLCYFSTDYVFDGRSTRPYCETDVAAPLNVYGQSKWDGEQAVRATLAEHFIVRLSWLYGQYGKHFVQTIVNKADELPVLRVVNDQQGCPTWTHSVAERVMALVETHQYGVYHMVSRNACSWYDLAREALRLYGKASKIEPICTKDMVRPAQRPAYSALDTGKLEGLLGKNVMPCWENALDQYVQTQRMK